MEPDALAQGTFPVADAWQMDTLSAPEPVPALTWLVCYQ